MTTITFDKKFDIKSNFIDIKDLYEYIIDNQLVTEIGELNENEVSFEMKQDLQKAKSLSSDMFVNLV